MPRFKVHVVRIGYRCVDEIVEADKAKQAKQKVEDAAGDISFPSEHDYECRIGKPIRRRLTPGTTLPHSQPLTIFLETIMSERPQRCATLRDCIIWAKDRLLDDLHDRVTDFDGSCADFTTNYAGLSARDRAAIRKEVQRLNVLLQLPEVSWESLKALAQAGYWNGADDDYWEAAVPPRTRPADIGDDLMPVDD